MPLSPIYRYLFAGLLFLYSGAQLFFRFMIPPEVKTELLSQNTWLFGFAGWFVIIFTLIFMSPSLLHLIFALRHRNKPEGLVYHKEVITDHQPIPEELADWEFELRTLGFDFFGMFRGTHTNNADNNYTGWLYVNEARDVYAGIFQFVKGVKAIEFTTKFADGFELGTLYNLALNVDGDIVYSRSFKGSISEAHAYHVYQLDLRSAEHGEPLKPETVADHLNTPEQDAKIQMAINDSVLRDNLRVVKAHSLYLAPALLMMMMSFVIPLFYADLLFAITTGIVFIVVDVSKLKLSYVTVDDTRKSGG